jgi:hypothetical protein
MVKDGRLDLVQGISTLEDNWAFSSVETIIDDLRPSQEFMEEEFGARPLVAWQVRYSPQEVARSLSNPEDKPKAAQLPPITDQQN